MGRSVPPPPPPPPFEPQQGTGQFGLGPPRLEVKTGDWACNGCREHNFARRDRCYKVRAAGLLRPSLSTTTHSVEACSR
jgi:hypothetical protein